MFRKELRQITTRQEPYESEANAESKPHATERAADNCGHRARHPNYAQPGQLLALFEDARYAVFFIG